MSEPRVTTARAIELIGGRDGSGSGPCLPVEPWEAHSALADLIDARARLAETEAARDASEAVLSMTVARLGGEVEGAPTHRINFLQRVDALRETEAREAALLDFAAAFKAWYPDCCQLLDGWHQDGTAWTEWDESVRRRLSDLGDIHKSATSAGAAAEYRARLRAEALDDVLSKISKRSHACGRLEDAAKARGDEDGRSCYCSQRLAFENAYSDVLALKTDEEPR